jgi:hypothetical protein
MPASFHGHRIHPLALLNEAVQSEILGLNNIRGGCSPGSLLFRKDANAGTSCTDVAMS